MRIEWPKGSGRYADYSDAEREFIRGFIQQKERGEITAEECNRQIGHFHDLKFELGVNIAPNGDEPDPATKFDAAAAGAARTEGEERALRAARVAEWKASAANWLSERMNNELFYADQLIETIGLPGDAKPGKNNVIGAWFSAQAKTGKIVFTGRFHTSERVIGHDNLQRIWRVVGDEKPPPPEPTPVPAKAPPEEPGGQMFLLPPDPG